MTERTGLDALADHFRAEMGPPVEERIAMLVDPKDMAVERLIWSIKFLRSEVLRLKEVEKKIAAWESQEIPPHVHRTVADALKAVAHLCDGDCGLSEEECNEANPVVLTGIAREGSPDETVWVEGTTTDIADVVVAVLKEK